MAWRRYLHIVTTYDIRRYRMIWIDMRQRRSSHRVSFILRYPSLFYYWIFDHSSRRYTLPSPLCICGTQLSPPFVPFTPLCSLAIVGWRALRRARARSFNCFDLKYCSTFIQPVIHILCQWRLKITLKVLRQRHPRSSLDWLNRNQGYALHLRVHLLKWLLYHQITLWGRRHRQERSNSPARRRQRTLDRTLMAGQEQRKIRKAPTQSFSRLRR